MTKHYYSEHEVTCPYCSFEDIDFEIGRSIKDGERFDHECPNCSKIFNVLVDFMPKYTCEADCRLNKDLPHELFESFSVQGRRYECLKCATEFHDFELPGGQYSTLKEGEFVMLKKKGGQN